MRLHTVQFGGIKICHADLWRAVFHCRWCHCNNKSRQTRQTRRRLGASTFGKQNRKLKAAPFPHEQPMTPSLIGHAMLALGSKPWLQLVSTHSSFVSPFVCLLQGCHFLRSTSQYFGLTLSYSSWVFFFPALYIYTENNQTMKKNRITNKKVQNKQSYV